MLGRDARDLGHDRRERDLLGIVDVHGHLRPLALAGQPERTHSRKAAAGLAQLRRHRSCDLRVRRVELDVEGDQRLTRRDEGRAGGRVRLLGAEVRHEIA